MLQKLRPPNAGKPLFVFYLLVVYVFLQFLWWSYLLFDLNQEIFKLRNELELLRDSGLAVDESLLKEQISKKRLMIFGEGLVFMLLLSLGILQTRRSFKREHQVARQQKNFLLSVTHELKSPVASVKLFLQTLEKRELDRNKQLEIINRAVSETNRLDQLIGNILMAAQLENHAFSIRHETLQLSEIANDFVERINLKHPGKRVKLELGANIQIEADPDALESILLNLTENALKYSPENEPVTLKIFSEDQKAVVQVIDRGQGIPEEEKRKIFEKFYRSGNEETRRHKGTGLGLYIVAILAGLHQAGLKVMENPGGGSIFELRLKLK